MSIFDKRFNWRHMINGIKWYFAMTIQKQRKEKEVVE